MGTLLIIYITLSFGVWIIVPVRQIGQKYFMFFLILIVGDIITLISRYAYHSKSNVFYIISDLLCLIAIQGRKASNLFKALILILSVATFIVEYYGFGYKQEFILIITCNFLLFFKFLQQSIIKYIGENIISIFLAFLTFYELIGVTKFFGLITDTANAASYFEIATLLQVLIGLFFCIFKENNPRLLVKLK